MMLLVALLLLACGEDRTHEYVEKTQHNHWVRERMLDQYLWADSLKGFEPTWKNFFSEPSNFLSVLTAKSKQNDQWSYLEIDTLDEDSHERGYFSHVESYGFDFIMMTDPTGQTTRKVLRVVTVYPDSPAERAGLMRNDYVCAYNGYKISNSNVARLQKGVARLLEVRHMAADEEEGFFYWADTVEVEMMASEYVEDLPFPVTSVIDAEGVKVGYVMCTRLVEYPVEQGSKRGNSPVYREKMDEVMAQMKSAGVDELVLDLRLCNYGTLEMARRLASYVVCPDALSSTFVQTFWNDNYTANNITLPYDMSVDNLGLSRIYILTSDFTQGAAEWLIHALQHSMGEENVITIGTATAGQNVVTEKVGSKFFVSLFPVVAYVADGDGDYEYGSIAPIFKEDEFSYMELHDYGDPDEILFNIAIQHILGLISQNDSESEEESDNSSEEEGVE